jgi:hypothetical protein
MMDKRKSELKAKKASRATIDNDEQIEEWRQERKKIRNPINPYLANIFYKILNRDYKKNFKKFSTTLLDLIGFNDHETNIALAVTERAKDGTLNVSIITEHPEINLNDVKIEYTGGVEVRIIHESKTSDKKIIMRFLTKEGEQQTIAMRVEYDPNKGEDMTALEKYLRGYDIR